MAATTKARGQKNSRWLAALVHLGRMKGSREKEIEKGVN